MRLISIPAALAGAGLLLGLGPSEPAEQIQWVTSYPEAKESAQAKNVLIMADFWADW